jgi:DNA-binding protein H-NS
MGAVSLAALFTQPCLSWRHRRSGKDEGRSVHLEAAVISPCGAPEIVASEMSATTWAQDPVKSRAAGGLTRRITPFLRFAGHPLPVESITKVMPESDEAKVAAAAWVREQMDRHGLTLDDLLEAGCFPAPAAPTPATPAAALAEPAPAPPAAPAPAPEAEKPARPLYRNALGQSWDGTGERPEWLQRAVNAGQTIEFFRVG